MNKGVRALKKYRFDKDMTQEELADKVELKRSTISSIEAGINKPSISTAKKLGNELGFDWTLFYEDEDEEE